MKYIIITGVSRGLGRSLSNTIAGPEDRLLGFGRSKGDFQGEFHSCDFTNPQLAASIIDSGLDAQTFEEAAEIVFVSNAGLLGPIGKAQNLVAFDIEKTISANLCGATIAATSFLKHVASLNVPKLFIQITSGAALPERAKASWSLYCACKAGQEQLIRAISKEQKFAPFPTKFINVNPGVMETAMQMEIRALSPEEFPEVAEFIKMKEEGKIPSPDTIAEKIKALIDDFPSLENGKTYTLANYKD